ncbi:hypothetical protein GYMLUDRAFT_53360 [Collybiopsis luxurians FD-317 M1]|nr:hypothetical protein GYMLUDRAFT_53360 [Collybiopsis luxurians FD-317 M1]
MPKSEDQKARARERYQERRQDHSYVQSPAYLAKRRAQGREAQARFNFMLILLSICADFYNRINHPDRIQRNNLNQRLKRKQRPEGEEDIEAENQSQPDNPGSDRRSPIASESSQVVTIKQLAAGSILAGTSWDEPSTFPNLSPPIPGSLRPGPSSNQLVGQEGVAESNATVLPLPRFSEGSHLLAQKKGDTGNSSGHTEPTSTLDHSSGPRGPVGAGVVAPTRVPNLNEISYLHQLSHLYSATPELAGDSEHTRTPTLHPRYPRFPKGNLI